MNKDIEIKKICGNLFYLDAFPSWEQEVRQDSTLRFEQRNNDGLTCG